MKMGQFAIVVVIGSCIFFAGCLEQAGVEVETEEPSYVEGSLVLIDSFEIISPVSGDVVYPDSVVEVAVTVSNAGSEIGMLDLYFSINGQIISAKTPSFRPGEEQILTFSTYCCDCGHTQSYLDVPGDYTLAVNDFQTMVTVADAPVALTVEGIEWQPVSSSNHPRYIPYVNVYVVNTGADRFPVDQWEMMINGRVTDNVVVTQFSTISRLEPYAEGRIVLKPNGVYSNDPNGADVHFSWIELRDVSENGLSGCLLGHTDL